MVPINFIGAPLRLVSRSTLIALFAAVAAAACQSGPAPGASPTHNPPPKPSTATVRVDVGDHGFQPSRVALGADRRLVFRRTSDATCATAVVFPNLGIEKSLPLNTDVAVDLPASARGEVGFQCGMGMYKSKVVVQ